MKALLSNFKKIKYDESMKMPIILEKQFNLEKGSQDSDSQAKAAPDHITQSVRGQGPLIACGSEGCEDFSKFNCFSRIIVIHGGPGMNHRYLKKPLEKAFKGCNLIFYDQMQKPMEKVTLCEYRRQLLTVIEKHPPCMIIAHSFGATLLFDFLRHHTLDTSVKVILISPLPKTNQSWNSCLNQLFNRIPEDTKNKIFKLLESNPEDGMELIREIFPYYLHDPRDYKKLEIDAYNMHVNLKIFNELGDWNFSGIEAKLPKDSLCIYGQTDLCYPLRKEYDIPTKIIANAGHFSFVEQEKLFAIAISGL